MVILSHLNGENQKHKVFQIFVKHKRYTKKIYKVAYLYLKTVNKPISIENIS